MADDTQRLRAAFQEAGITRHLSCEQATGIAEATRAGLRTVEQFALAEGIIPERYDRNIGTLGADGQRTLLASCAAVVGLASEAREHAETAMRLSPRDTDIWLGEGYGALALASFTEGYFAETLKWARLAIQMHGNMPVRQALMIASNAYLGDLESAGRATRPPDRRPR